MLIGFSTVSLSKTHKRVSAETFEFFRLLGCNAIEVMCAGDEDLEKLVGEIVPNDLRDFEYMALHAPAIYEAKTLKLLKKAQDIFGFKTIVIHPDEVENWEMLKRFSLPFAIENMDWRREIGKYTESMEEIFKKHDMPMVLDLNHCFTNDPSMKLAEEMREKFAEKIKEIHLSGFEQEHEPLFKTKQKEILNAIYDENLPIVIESECETVEDAGKEFEYVRSFLAESGKMGNN